jgi:hypothetical protein
MPKRQYTTPMLVADDLATPLRRLDFADKSLDENWLQQLLYDHPALIPVREIEPVFDGLIALGREIPTHGAGRIDNLYCNADGYLTIVETKLWRNPEAQRRVVAQILDYAKQVATWTYGDLERAVATARGISEGNEQGSLLALVRKSTDGNVEESEFADTVSRTLASGTFLLLIVGDGIREGLERLSEFIQQAPRLGFTLGLVEIGVFQATRDGKGPLYVQPRIVARTREVTRAVVRVDLSSTPPDVVVDLPRDDNGDSISKDAFLARIAKYRTPEVAAFLDQFTEKAESGDHELDIEWGKSASINYSHADTGYKFRFAVIGPRARIETRLALRWFLSSGVDVEICRRFLDGVAALIPNAKRTRIGQGMNEAVRLDGKVPLIDHLVGKGDKLLEVIDETIAEIESALADR